MLRYLVIGVQAQILHSVLNYQGDGLVPVLIQMKAPARLIEKIRNATFPSSDARAEELVRRLQAFSVRTQKLLIPLLDKLRAENEASQFRSYFVSNTVAVEATQKAIAQIYDLNDVYKIGPNFISTPLRHRRDSFYPESGTHTNPAQAPVDYGPALKRIGIHQVNPRIVRKAKKLKYANMDSGTDYSHPSLADSYSGYNGKSFNHSYAWFDASRDVSPLYPRDTLGHGTKVLSLAVGKHPIGISPRSKWIACLSNKHHANPTELYLSCQQFLLAPTNLKGETPSHACAPTSLAILGDAPKKKIASPIPSSTPTTPSMLLASSVSQLQETLATRDAAV
ncbi:hypothetical protein DSO57_1037708 [Entomophthora muscae]|uniref:Uncharacterized protein n=1 Tax=Entomophthora muscae TaxID=34485 RepID=A0ACC2SCB7_9FUNG|nr:hypothetical protein DSO57_1037708 [Entomophthora muscae]